MIQGHGYNMSLMQLFGKGPKWDFHCDECGETWSKRLPMFNYPLIVCPGCEDRTTLDIVWRT